MNIEVNTLVLDKQEWFSPAATQALGEFQKSQQQAAKVASEAEQARAGVSLAETGKEALRRAQAARVVEFDSALASVEVCEAAERLVARIDENGHALSLAEDAERSRLKAEHEAALRGMVDTRAAGHRDIRVLARQNPSPAMQAHRRNRQARKTWITGQLHTFREALAQCQQASRNELERVAAAM